MLRRLYGFSFAFGDIQPLAERKPELLLPPAVAFGEPSLWLGNITAQEVAIGEDNKDKFQ